MALEVKTESDCRLLFSEIINGYSRDPSGKYFIKHYTEVEFGNSEYIRLKNYQEAKKNGLLSEKEKLDLIIDKGHWSKEEEKDYQDSLETLEGLRNSVKKLIIPQQIKHMQGMIEENEKEFSKKERSRSSLLGVTLEQFANRRASEYHVLHSFYNSPSLNSLFFSDDELNDLNEQELKILIDIYNQSHECFTEKNIKKVAVCPFFLNAFFICKDNPYSFFGKPVTSLTIYQIALFSKGGYYKGIVEDSYTQKVPEEYYKDLDNVVAFYDKQFAISQGKRNAERSKH